MEGRLSDEEIDALVGAARAEAQAQSRSESVPAAHPAEFGPLTAGPVGGTANPVSMLLDVPLEITVELGRARKTIGEVLQLAPGSIVELDRLAGEPVDILANGRRVARGEVVVVDEQLGVRLTEIVSWKERLIGISE